jgi:tyrosinase
MDIRRNFSSLSADGRKRVIAAIKWMKTNERSGVDGATAAPSSDGGVYQRYVMFHSVGGVEADLGDFGILLAPEPKDTLHSIVIDAEEHVSAAKHPVTEAGLKNFLDEVSDSISGGGQTAGGPFNVMNVVPPTPIPVLTGQINRSPFTAIKLRKIPDGASAPTEQDFTRTPTAGGPKYQLNTYQMAHRSPMFLPWHRVLLRIFERDLQFADKHLGKDGKITLPYWSFSRQNDWDEKAKSSVWHKENFGGFSDTPEGTITGDHFSPGSGWELFDAARAKLTGIAGELRRIRTSVRVASPSDTLPLPEAMLPTAKALETLLTDADYIGPSRGGGGGGNRRFAGRLEHDVHDPMHGNVGGDGQMSDMLFSPQDPIFWLFHCNVDRIWSRWQKVHDKGNDSKYPKFGMLPGRRRDDAMQPWAVSVPDPPYKFNARIKDVLNAANFGSGVNANNLLGKGYKYDTLDF